MDNLSVTDIVALIGVAVMLYQKFFSKEDKRKAKVDNEKTAAETNKTEAELAQIYEQTLKDNLDRMQKLEKDFADYKQEKEKESKLTQKKIADQEKEIKKIKKELEKRDRTIDCLDISYRELAQKARNAGVDVSLDAPCFNFEDDEDENIL